jgi:protein-S-isoprenylcysteine O-methyltransferase Ste14
MKNAHRIMPTIYFIILMALSIGMHFLYPINKILYPPFTYFGFLLILFGILLNLWTDMLFKKENTTVKPFKDPKVFLTSGPFRISRHPMYLGMASILLGVSIIHGTIVTFLFPIIFLILMELLFIPFEENNLNRIFGFEYLNYKKKVRRWI